MLFGTTFFSLFFADDNAFVGFCFPPVFLLVCHSILQIGYAVMGWFSHRSVFSKGVPAAITCRRIVRSTVICIKPSTPKGNDCDTSEVRTGADVDVYRTGFVRSRSFPFLRGAHIFLFFTLCISSVSSKEGKIARRFSKILPLPIVSYWPNLKTNGLGTPPITNSMFLTPQIATVSREAPFPPVSHPRSTDSVCAFLLFIDVAVAIITRRTLTDFRRKTARAPG